MKTITLDGIEYQLTPVPTEAPKPVQWKPKQLNRNQRYWFIDSGGGLHETDEDLLTIDTKRASFGNYFHTEAEAQEAAKQVRQLLRLRAYVREFAPDYKPDWGDYTEQKWHIFFDEKYNEWSYSNNQFMRNITTVYMPECVAKDLVCKLDQGEVVL